MVVLTPIPDRPPPPPQVNLKTGVPADSINETCTAGAGSLLVEFGILSRLLGDSTFEWVARRAVRALWSLRSKETGLLGQRKGRVEDKGGAWAREGMSFDKCMTYYKKIINAFDNPVSETKK